MRETSLSVIFLYSSERLLKEFLSARATYISPVAMSGVSGRNAIKSFCVGIKSFERYITLSRQSNSAVPVVVSGISSRSLL